VKRCLKLVKRGKGEGKDREEKRKRGEKKW
jgi:hypothetical protein